jgi:DnaJ like chaperone protein
VAKGLPEEMMKLATAKAQEIKGAYERIKDARGMR